MPYPSREPIEVEILQCKGDGEWHVCELKGRIWRGVNDLWFRRRKEAVNWATENGYKVLKP